MQYELKVDYEVVSKIVQQVLLEDYTYLKQECVRLRALGDAIKPHDKEDLEHNEQFVNGFEALLLYYFPYDEGQRIINQYK